MRNMTIDYPELEPYYEFRTILKEAQDTRTLLLKDMKALDIPMSENEVYTIYRFVTEREIKKGIPVTHRFRDALFSNLEVHPGIVGSMYSPIWDPWNSGVDCFTKEDEEAIKRVLAKRN
ncbi:hypothetical protein [Streptohalobacillus salinus]|uniref:hypothetical protein n=1 Tax=Streptohalobacillus salinus TaxID=621096 RepID=UPI0011B23F2F|nr:hypothetical protein [Streptohalobacillus salinus]